MTNLKNTKIVIFVMAAAILAGSALVVNPTRPIYAQDSGPFVKNIVTLAKENTNFRQEIKTANHTQVVLMSLKPGEDIGLEVHKTIDQILVFVQGSGEANISGQKFPIKEGDLAFVPAGTSHDFTNTGNTDLKVVYNLFTTKSPSWNTSKDKG